MNINALELKVYLVIYFFLFIDVEKTTNVLVRFSFCPIIIDQFFLPMFVDSGKPSLLGIPI